VRKLRIGIVYGGRSSEHEVSVASAAAIWKHLDRDRYEPIPIRIEKDGRWVIADRPPVALAASEVIEQARASGAQPGRQGRLAHMLAYPAEEPLLTIERRRADEGVENASVTGLGLDVIFPVLHGPYGEDGTVQGLLELANVPYVGAGVLASAAGMDKAVMKVLFAARGLPVGPHRALLHHEWRRDRDGWLGRLAELGTPVFVKPANMGSSIGISKARDRGSLASAVDLAFEFDRKVVVEQAVPAAREIECAVLGNDEPRASVAGEIIPSREFYDYEAKYLDAGSELRIPAALSAAEQEAVQRMALDAFRAVDAAGMARVDFLMERESGRIVVNEVNTIPGFTTISMYAKLWGASGLEYRALLDTLVRLALERHAAKQHLRTSVV
jgi:D-alanine-D-alanine ligase